MGIYIPIEAIIVFITIMFLVLLFGFITDLQHYIKKNKEEENACKKKDQEET